MKKSNLSPNGKRLLTADSLIKKWRKDPKYMAAYKTVEEEYVLADALIKARAKARLSQAQLAERMGTSQPAVARMEAGRLPSMATLKRFAEATGTRLRISFVEA